MAALTKWCTPLDEFEGVTPGMSITFDKTSHDSNGVMSRSRQTGTVTEVWREDHPNVGYPMFYFETLVDGEPRRVWCHRDHVAAASDDDIALGAAPVGAMF